MKKSIFFVLAIIAATVAFAQTDNKKRPSLAIHFSLIDYKSAMDVRTKSLDRVINDKQFLKFKRMDPALSISYLEGFTNKIDIAATLTGAFVKHPTSEAVSNNDGNDHFLLEAAATANFKLLSDNYFFTPFLTLGVGASKWKGYFSAFTPVGVGLQFKIADGTFFLVNSQYRIPVTENAAYHFYHSIGFASAIVAKKAQVVVLPPAPPVVLDRDGDGVLDADDKCPTVKGFARYQGCPIPDTDGDGINDEEDKGPTRVGPASNQGCPVIAKEVIEKINFAAKNVFFATGSYKLLPKSFKSLDEVVKLLKEDETLMIDIDGHTDAQGSDESNQVLSDNRAGAVKTYFVSKGISETRLKSAGYGETKPVADNTTAAGRAKNRRTEMTVRNF